LLPSKHLTVTHTYIKPYWFEEVASENKETDMKIIKGRDYYDNAGCGVDTDIMFVRDCRSLDVNSFGPMYGAKEDIKPIGRKSGITYRVSEFLVTVGRLVIPGLIVSTRKYIPKSDMLDSEIDPNDEACNINFDKAEIIFDKDIALARLLEIKKKCRYFNVAFDTRSVIDRIFRVNHEKINKWAIIEQAVTSVTINRAFYEDCDKSYYNNDSITFINGDFLKDYKIYQVIDPATAHMEIANWIGGVLPSKMEDDNLSDKTKIQKAGFDLVSSFRKSPGKKNRKK
jgi:hypothetical protein